MNAPYRGRLAPSPTGYLHLGHARSFWTAYQRSLQHRGTLVMRNEDLDPQRSQPEYAAAMPEDLRWLGIEWSEGLDVGGPFGPYLQSQRRELYLAAWKSLLDGGWIYPCSCSRKDLASATQAPHEGVPDLDGEPLYPGTCRNKPLAERYASPVGMNWRFRVPEGETIAFHDAAQGGQKFTAGVDFGDFVVWRRDDIPAYQLAVVVDDDAMRITEVVRGEDLLLSTARQILLMRGLDLQPPAWFHCGLVRDQQGNRLAKRNDALSLRALRAGGISAEEVRQMCEQPNLPKTIPMG
jgi:glutamyl-tRNA synthetase